MFGRGLFFWKHGEKIHNLPQFDAGGDLDRDGDWVPAVSRLNQPIVRLEPTSAEMGNRVQISLAGTKSPKMHIGTTISLSTEYGQLVRQLVGGNSGASKNDARIHFGQGSASVIQK